MSSKCVILGSGTSYGVPVIGCECAVCHSSDSRDRRLRSAAWLVGQHGTSVLIDAGPDLRMQCLRAGVTRLDGVLLTHTHADHVNGLDDLRAFTLVTHTVLPFYCSTSSAEFVRSHFEYIFDTASPSFGWGIPRLELHECETEPFQLGEFTVQPVPLLHGRFMSMGWRIGRFAYLTDCSAIPDDSWQYLHGVKLLVIDALRWRTHPTHHSIGESLAVRERMGNPYTVFTHMSHEICHADDSQKLPPGVAFAYDGMELEWEHDSV